MLQPRSRANFTQKSITTERRAQIGVQNLDGYIAIMSQVVGEEDGCHATCTELAIDARSDLYALAAVTYEMLAGEPPFTGPTVQAILARVMTEEPRALVAQRKAIPDYVDYAVMRGLEKLPADRWATASEFAAALQGATATHGSTGAARPRGGSRTVTG